MLFRSPTAAAGRPAMETTTPRRAAADSAAYVSMSPSPSHTPRSVTKAKRPLNNGAAVTASSPSPSLAKGGSGGGGVNIQVLLRCRYVLRAPPP